MSSASVVVNGHRMTVEATVIETSAWCDVRMLPSVIRFTVHTLCTHGVRLVGTGERCVEHEGDGRSS